MRDRLDRITKKELMRQIELLSITNLSSVNSSATNASLPCFAIPPYRQYFLPNYELVRFVTDHFYESKRTGRLHSYAVHGEGGVGKTSFVLNYAHHCKDQKIYDAIFWVRAQNSSTIKESWTEIVYRLGLSSPAMRNLDNHPILIKNWLSSTGKHS